MILSTLVLMQATTPELGAALSSVGTGPEDGEPKPAAQDPDFRTYYKGGLRFETADGMYKFKMGGRIHFDSVYVGNNKAIESALRGGGGAGGAGPTLDDALEFRRARYYISGRVADEVDFKAQYDFAGGDADFKDVYLGFDCLDFGYLKVGQFKEPFSLEELTSSNNITFNERSVANAFSPGRSTGFQLSNTAADGQITWAVGAFKDSNAYGDFVGMADGEWAATGRLTGTPVNDDDTLVHLGVAASVRAPGGDMARFRARPETHVTPRFVDTGAFAAEDETRIGLEAAWVSGPWSLQGEYIMTDTSDPAGDASLTAYYVEGSYFFTDDERPYDATKGAFKGVSPSGDDAWQGKLRYSSIDLTDGPVAGGELMDITVGANWYLNDNVRLMFEVINADLDGVDSTMIGQVRCQVTW